jgi:REP element-mobilizing transposase RayT
MPLFEITNSYDLVYNWFAVLKEKYNADVVAYVIMPNHLHAVLHFYNENFDLNNIISNGKRFMAYEVINRLQAYGNNEVLDKLSSLLSEREKKKGQLHKVFKDSFDAKAIITQHFLLQKINYIHNNPVSGKWQLAKDFVDYEHSSASFYEIQLVRHFKPLHYLDL